MSAYRVLVEFLRSQAKNRAEQADIRGKDTHPNGQLIGKLRTEARHFEQAANLIEPMPAPTSQTSEESDRARLAPAVIVADKPKNKGGRPKKFTAKEIAEASKGPVAARDRGMSDDAAAVAALERA